VSPPKSEFHIVAEILEMVPLITIMEVHCCIGVGLAKEMHVLFVLLGDTSCNGPKASSLLLCFLTRDISIISHHPFHIYSWPHLPNLWFSTQWCCLMQTSFTCWSTLVGYNRLGV